MASVNEARVANGLVPLRSDYRLWTLADERATAMASLDVLSHGAGGPLDGALGGSAIQWYGYGEVIACDTPANIRGNAKVQEAYLGGHAPVEAHA